MKCPMCGSDLKYMAGRSQIVGTIDGDRQMDIPESLKCTKCRYHTFDVPKKIEKVEATCPKCKGTGVVTVVKDARERKTDI